MVHILGDLVSALIATVTVSLLTSATVGSLVDSSREHGASATN